MKFAVLFLTLFVIQNAYSQALVNNDPKDFKTLFRKAERSFQVQEYKDAIVTYNELIEIDPSNNNLHFLLGYSYLMAKSDPEFAVKHLRRATSSIRRIYREGAYHERNTPTLTYFLLGKAYQKNYQFDLAIESYEQYKGYLDLLAFAEIEYVNRHIQSCYLAKSMIKNPVSVNFVTLAPYTSENYACNHPVVSGNDSMLIFTIEEQEQSIIAAIFRQKDGWSSPIMLDFGWDMPGNFYPSSVSYDGKELYLVYKDIMISDIYVSRFTQNSWSDPEPLGREINSPYDETHASISFDGQSLYFTSNRKGGWGGSDIYVSHRNEDGSWMEPENLGFGINTYYNEETPFIAQNDSVLYYSSDGFQTMGGYDIYMARLDLDALFLEPLHLGYPISTPDDDLYFNPGWDGITNYYVRKAYKAENSTIYTIINGTREVVKESEKVVEHEIDDHYYFVNAILFDYNTYELNDSARNEMEYIYAMMYKNPTIEIELIGHTDDIGSKEFNLELSNNRAESVKEYLVGKGISEDRIQVVAMGEDDPVAINRYEDGSDAPGGRSLNRNVSIRLTNKVGDNIRMAEIFVPPSLVPVQDRVYTILLLETAQLLDTMPNEISGQPVSLIYTDESKMYVLGSYSRITDAHDYLDEVIDNGYPDAYVMEKRNFESAIRKRTHGDQMENLEFTIQVIALKNPVEVSYFSEIKEVRIFKGTDGFHRYAYGNYKGITEAQRALSELKKMRKYRNAFIRPLSFYENISSN
ncbi:OmpA family protein [Bacteroidota bacterium]